MGNMKKETNYLIINFKDIWIRLILMKKLALLNIFIQK